MILSKPLIDLRLKPIKLRWLSLHNLHACVEVLLLHIVHHGLPIYLKPIRNLDWPIALPL
jgi:hypothetical protein